MTADDAPAAARSRLKLRPGSRYPVGVTWTPVGTNFSVFSREAVAIALLLREEGSDETRIVELDPLRNRSFYFWHVFVERLPEGTRYNWRVTLPGDDGRPEVLEVLDPWARAVADGEWRRDAGNRDGAGLGMEAIVVDSEGFDWGRYRARPRGLDGAIIYELHVGGYTRHPSSGVRHPGTFAGLAEKVDYLRDLGVTHVQLLPVAAFDEQDVPPGVAARGLRNYWGYSPHSFGCPHPGYCTGGRRTRTAEFKTLVRTLQEAGLKVILDVVLNHTAEGGAEGPVINYKGLAPGFFYHRDGDTYRDYTGCGNTINCNHPLVTSLLVNSLERWVEEYRIDGFRFDLASVFARGEDGEPLRHPPLPWAIEFSRTLSELPLIAEAWDAGGLYHVGSFPGLAWSEWNGRYRDVVRRAVRGDGGLASELATALAGSSDLYRDDGRLPINSINFVTCHDGFTLHDLVSYDRKHNEANGEHNRDGSNHNHSWNCGVEGPTDDRAVLALRARQARNFMAVLLLSQGVPMILAGDEFLRSQGGNNNAWCQDNEISWIDWRLLDAHGDMHRFTREMIRLRRRHPSLMRRHFLTGDIQPGRGIPDVSWHGPVAGSAPFEAEGGRFLAFTLAGTRPDEEDLHIVLNFSARPVRTRLPPVAGRRWCLAVDTGRTPPADIVEIERQRPLPGPDWEAGPRSVLVFESR